MLLKTVLQKVLLLLVLSLTVSACSVIYVEPDFDRDESIEQSIINQTTDSFPEIDLLALDQEMIDYLTMHIDPQARNQTKVEKLRELLFNEEHLNIQYRDSANYSAIDTFRTREANCLSLVNLYVAMARHVGIDANYHTVQIRPRWDRRGELLVISEHINATGRLTQNTRYVVDFTPELSLQQLTAAVISDAAARALYFNNLGVEKLIQQSYDEAVVYFQNALWINPQLAIAWNNLGATFNRLGKKELAEYSYQRSFDIDNSNATAINNLAKFYFNHGDTEKAEIYTKAIQRFNNRNPYYHFLLGNVAYSEGSFDQARRHYRNAIRRKDAEPDFYLAMGLTYRQMGMENQAQEMLAMAVYMEQQADVIYQPSNEKLRVIDTSNSIFRRSSSGFTIQTN